MDSGQFCKVNATRKGKSGSQSQEEMCLSLVKLKETSGPQLSITLTCDLISTFPARVSKLRHMELLTKVVLFLLLHVSAFHTLIHASGACQVSPWHFGQ